MRVTFYIIWIKVGPIRGNFLYQIFYQKRSELLLLLQTTSILNYITGGVDEEEHTKIGCVFLFGPEFVVCSP